MLSQILLNSIISALLLSLVALGFNLIFNATKVFHIAHGAMYVSAVYGLFQFNTYFKHFFPKGVSITISVILSLLVICILIVIIEYSVYRPLYRRRVSSAISLISSLGIYLFLVNFITFLFGNESIALSNDHNVIAANDYFRLTDVELNQVIISSILITLVLLFSRTKYYINIRAITDDYLISEKFGINIQKTRMIALIFGTILIGFAGIIKSFEVAIEPNVGLTTVLSASVAVIVGGVSSLKGSIIACLLIAIIDNYSVTFLSPQWKEMLIYGLLIVVLIFYQQGLISVKQRIEIR